MVALYSVTVPPGLLNGSGEGVELFGLGDFCPHMGAQLDLPRLQRVSFSRFEGRCVTPPPGAAGALNWTVAAAWEARQVDGRNRCFILSSLGMSPDPFWVSV
jgi:hypothetical protein